MLVGGFNLSEKYEFVSWDDDMMTCPIYGKIIKSCSKPLTSHGFPEIHQAFLSEAALAAQGDRGAIEEFGSHQGSNDLVEANLDQSWTTVASKI